MKNATEFPFIGTASAGTMRSEDLIPAFADLLGKVLEWTRENVKPPYVPGFVESEMQELNELLTRLAKIDDGEDSPYWISEEAGYDLEYLFDTLDFYAPDGMYFGANMGDGTDYGYWPAEE